MKSSSWQVVALGELQQPGGVGATQDYNPVVDGPNPDAQLIDNAGNSPEQEVALETWVNMAVDMLNRGETPEAIIAKLAHDGCPDPEEILRRAQAQPQQQPISDEIGQSMTDKPMPQDGVHTDDSNLQGTSVQPPVLGNVRIAGKNWRDYAKTMKYAGEADSAVDGEAHPVSEIEKFIANMPEVKPSRPYIEARVKNIETSRRAIRGIFSKATYADQQKLSALDAKLADEQTMLRAAGSDFDPVVDPEREAMLPEVGFAYNAFHVATPEIQAYEGNVKEAALIWASETPFDAATRRDDFTFSAIQEGERLGLNPYEMTEFINTAQTMLAGRVARVAKVAAVTELDFDGPAAELFI